MYLFSFYKTSHNFDHNHNSFQFLFDLDLVFIHGASIDLKSFRWSLTSSRLLLRRACATLTSFSPTSVSPSGFESSYELGSFGLMCRQLQSFLESPSSGMTSRGPSQKILDPPQTMCMIFLVFGCEQNVPLAVAPMPNSRISFLQLDFHESQT